MTIEKIEATLRKRPGKGPSRRLRDKGLVPAVIYGHGIETTALAISPRALVKALAGSRRLNTLLEIAIEGRDAPQTAMVRDHQYDPVTRQLLHVDLYAIQMDNKIKVEVPLTVSGRSQGEQLGGTLSKKFRTLPVECLPADIPEAIVADVTALAVDAAMTAKDIVMPEKTTLLLADKTVVIEVIAKRAETEATTAEGGVEQTADAPAATSDSPKGKS